MDKQTLTDNLRRHALALGFDLVGIAPARRLDEEAARLEAWLQGGMQGKMHYMERYYEERLDPRRLVEGAKSVVSLLFNYYPSAVQADPQAPKLASYAYGKDYHEVLKDKLRALLEGLQGGAGAFNGRCFVDSAPVMERQWAVQAGLGWTGKNTLLINKRRGSYFFLAELIIDIELVYDAPFVGDHCGTCRRCIEACPTEAIGQTGFVIDASRCISYLTIELREDIPAEFKGKMDGWMFGCDVCQMVCPWNRFAEPHNEAAFAPPPDLLEMKRGDWQELTEEVFRRVLGKSAVKRAKYVGLKRNIAFLE